MQAGLERCKSPEGREASKTCITSRLAAAQTYIVGIGQSVDSNDGGADGSKGVKGLACQPLATVALQLPVTRTDVMSHRVPKDVVHGVCRLEEEEEEEGENSKKYNNSKKKSSRVREAKQNKKTKKTKVNKPIPFH